ncbi:terminase small subunit [uncultured Methylobacterium sp.]|uniref:terminase small subunit n=1 Tax=uncultured Methylobacterium sp. TaxID=157278 RepID=UPI0035C9ED3A
MLTDKQASFVQEYLVDMNASAAARRAGYSADTAGSIGHENLTKPEIVDAIAVAQAARADRVQITADQVLRELVDIAQTDANELIEHRVGSCRFCHGDGFRYQRTPREFEEALADHDAVCDAIIEKGRDDPLPVFNEKGGVGFNPRKAPHPDCPECFGEGVGRAVFKDTGKASAAARRLYAGVKLTKDGMEMKLHPKMDAVEKLFRHLGMAAPTKAEITGKDGGAIKTADVTDAELARRIAFTLRRSTIAGSKPKD